MTTTEMRGKVGIYHHRGYRICRYTQRHIPTWKCWYIGKYINLHLPRSFVWTAFEQLHLLREYIDHLMYRRTDEAARIEKRGFVTEQEFQEYDRSHPMVNINIARLICILRGEEILELPSDAVVSIRKSKRHATSFHAWLASEEVDRLLKEAQTASELPLEAPEPERVPEIPVSTQKLGDHIEQVTVVAAQPPYFVRRLLDYDKVVWAGTSYSAKGPWKVYDEVESLEYQGMRA